MTAVILYHPAYMLRLAHDAMAQAETLSAEDAITVAQIFERHGDAHDRETAAWLRSYLTVAA